jgi:hypothetical protein
MGTGSITRTIKKHTPAQKQHPQRRNDASKTASTLPKIAGGSRSYSKTPRNTQQSHQQDRQRRESQINVSPLHTTKTKTNNTRKLYPRASGASCTIPEIGLNTSS